ncbi:MAG: cupin domain-containing protein, partial [Alphaproteobacteria bacterium]
VVVAGEEHPLCPGTTCFLGPGVSHEIINDSSNELVMLWVITPSGLDKFFAEIGRPRQPGEATPKPFSRPADIRAIEKGRGFRDIE